MAVLEQLHRALERRVDRRRRAPEASFDQVAQLVDHGRVTVRGQNVQQRLRSDDLPDRRRERRRADFRADLVELVEYLVEAIACGPSTQLDVEGGDNSDGNLALRGAHGDARRDRRDGLVADVLVDEVCGGPELVQIYTGVETQSGERLRCSFRGDAVHRQCDRIGGDSDHVGARARGLERGGEGVAAGALRVEADRQTGHVTQLGDELTRAVRLQNRGRIVQEDARGAHLRQPLCGVDERLMAAPSVEEARLELGARRDDRLGSLTEVVDVIQRVVQAEDVDAALGSARDEPAREVSPDGTRANEEAPAQRKRKRRFRPRLERADPLPRALDTAANGGVEDAPTRDLQVRKTGSIEELREAQ